MRSRYALALGLLGAILSGGCSHPPARATDSVRVAVEGGGEFPAFLVGQWQAPQHGWEFQFEPDGRLSSAMISLGRVRVVPGRTTTMPTRSGDKAVFTPGPWMVHYAPQTRELTVRITMDHVRIEMAGSTVEGSCTDTFVGPIAPTGRTWQAQWTAFTRYQAHTAENTVVDLSTDPTAGETKPLTFEKVDRVSP